MEDVARTESNARPCSTTFSIGTNPLAKSEKLCDCSTTTAWLTREAKSMPPLAARSNAGFPSSRPDDLHDFYDRNRPAHVVQVVQVVTLTPKSRHSDRTESE